MSGPGPEVNPAPPLVPVDAIAAADQYRRAVELHRRARAQLIDSCERDRGTLNLRGLALRAGMNESTLYKMLNGRSSANGTRPT